MKRWIALVLSVLAVLVVTTGPVGADPAAPPAAPTSAPVPKLPADAIALSDSRVKGNGLAVTLDSGASEEHDLVLANHTSDLRLSVRLTATDAGGNLGQGAASWLSFGDDVVSIEPHGVAIVPLTIAVPHDTQPASTLAHVNASVETAVAAADGSPRLGTAAISFPVSITVRGTPTAQVAIADVHRVDQDDQHTLAVVLRNYSNQTVPANGTVRVFGSQPQTLPFSHSLPPGRDTTLSLPWKAPPVGSGVDIAVDMRYGNGSVASWSSTLGGPPSTVLPTDANANTSGATPTTSATATQADTATATTPAGAHKPWYDGKLVPILVVLALLGAAAWFVWELRSSKRRRDDPSYAQPFFMMPGSGSPDATAELAKQLVRLTEIIVELTTRRAGGNHDGGNHDDGEVRARGPDPPSSKDARAGPAPPGDGSPPDSDPSPRETLESQTQLLRSPASPPSVPARPDPGAPEPLAPEPEADSRAAILARLADLDHDRRRLRQWMDEADARDAEGEEWPSAADLEAFRARTEPDENES